MINITVKHQNDYIENVTIEGHSNFAPKGQDIVCAAVSAISEGSLNAIIEMTKMKPDFEMKDGYLNMNFSADEKVQTIVRVMLIQLKTVEEAYSKYIHIKEK